MENYRESNMNKWQFQINKTMISPCILPKKNTENITCHIASSMTNAYFCKKNTCKVLIGTIVLIVLNCKYANVFQADF